MHNGFDINIKNNNQFCGDKHEQNNSLMCENKIRNFNWSEGVQTLWENVTGMGGERLRKLEFLRLSTKLAYNFLKNNS